MASVVRLKVSRAPPGYTNTHCPAWNSSSQLERVPSTAPTTFCSTCAFTGIWKCEWSASMRR